MADEPEADGPRDFIASELILDHLTAIQGSIDELSEAIGRIDGRLQALEAQLDGLRVTNPSARLFV